MHKGFVVLVKGVLNYLSHPAHHVIFKRRLGTSRRRVSSEGWGRPREVGLNPRQIRIAKRLNVNQGRAERRG